MNRRYLRNEDIIHQEKLIDDIDIIGAGGIGSFLLLLLSKMGFKRIHIWDNDEVEEWNLSTGLFYNNKTEEKKVNHLKQLAKDFGDTEKLVANAAMWTDKYDLHNRVFVCPDNMEVRKEAFEKWTKNPNREFFIDGRMGALGMQCVSIVKGKEDFYWKTWCPSTEVPDEPCTMKHTIFTASIISGIMANQAFAIIENKYYEPNIMLNLANMFLVKR